MRSHFEALGKTPANHVPLTPVSFLRRAALVFGPREAISYGPVRRTWAEVGARCCAIADSMVRMGVQPGDTVTVLSPNIPEMFELHYAVPLAGAVLNTVNTRLEAETIAYILDHADSTLVIADTHSAPVLREAFARMGRSLPVIDIVDPQADPVPGFGERTYDDLVAQGDPTFEGLLPTDEWEALALNYTSGTSGRPKGVVYHHRGAYLMSMGTVAGWSMTPNPVYMSVVPMFHCNGWNHPWAMAIVGARLVFTRDPQPERLFRAIREEGVTHFGAAPIILASMADYDGA
ncbi:MAG: AMP-binding protein, partial [Pseudomonadota bacterium]